MEWQPIYVLGVCLLTYMHSLTSRSLPSFLASVPTPGCHYPCRAAQTAPLCNGLGVDLPNTTIVDKERFEACWQCRSRTPPFEALPMDGNFYNLQDGACIAHWQYGIIMGFGFAVPFVIGSMCTARWVDSLSSHVVLTWSALAWSLATSLQAIAQSPMLIMLSRLLLGISQANTVPTTVELVTANFDKSNHGLVMNLLSAGVCLGAAFASFAVPLSSRIGWRAATATTGAAGLVLATLIGTSVRGQRPQCADEEDANDLDSRRRSSFRNTPVVWVFTLGTSCRLVVGYTLAVYLPVYYLRAGLAGYDGDTYAMANSVIVATTGVASALCAGLAADYFSPSFPKAPLVIVSLAQVCAAMFALGIFLAKTFTLSLAFYAAALLTGECWLGLILLQVRQSVSPALQGQTVTVLLSLATVACEAGPAIVGFLDTGDAEIGKVMMLLCASGYISSGFLFAAPMLWRSQPKSSLTDLLAQDEEEDNDIDSGSERALAVQGVIRSGAMMMSQKSRESFSSMASTRTLRLSSQASLRHLEET